MKRRLPIDHRDEMLLLVGWANVIRFHNWRELERLGGEIFVRNVREQWRMTLRRAAFLSSALTTYQGPVCGLSR